MSIVCLLLVSLELLTIGETRSFSIHTIHGFLPSCKFLTAACFPTTSLQRDSSRQTYSE